MLGCQIGFWRVQRIFREISVTQGLMEPKLHILYCSRFFVFYASLPPQSGATMAMVNPLAGADHQIAGWFHAHLSQALVNLLRVFSEPGSAQLIGVVLFLAVIFFVWKRAWTALVIIIVAVCVVMVITDLFMLAVHR